MIPIIPQCRKIWPVRYCFIMMYLTTNSFTFGGKLSVKMLYFIFYLINTTQDGNQITYLKLYYPILEFDVKSYTTYIIVKLNSLFTIIFRYNKFYHIYLDFKY